jgi:hypothetical protein
MSSGIQCQRVNFSILISTRNMASNRYINVRILKMKEGFETHSIRSNGLHDSHSKETKYDIVFR